MTAEKPNGPYCVDRIGVARLTKMAFDGANLRPLWHELMEKVSDDAEGAGIGMDLSIIAQLLGDQKTGLAIQKEVLGYQRLFRSPCAKVPRLRVLALAAEMDIGGNTPIEFLLEGGDVELLTLYVVPGRQHPVPPHDIAIVVAPDDHRTQETLDEIEHLVVGWPGPVLNHPRHIRSLDRDRLCGLIETIRGLTIPPTTRLARAEFEALGHCGLAIFPLVVRPVGSHAGHGLAKLDSQADVRDYLSGRAESEFFVSSYVDYASADGQFRKYRIVFVDGRPYACHMAISDQWKIWYLNADMAMSDSKRAEEAHFMETFDREFTARHAAALAELASRIGLDYFQIDCAETPSGELLIFEADNAAIVHDMDSPAVFPYKAPQMRKIFDAFVAMLYNRAGASQVRAA
jgi:hypothetical protein